MIKMISYISLVLTLISCVTESNLIEIKKFNTIKFSTDRFNANYSNQDSTSWRLWETLYECYSFKISKIPVPYNAIINLSLKKDNILHVSAYDGNIMIDEIDLKGKPKENYFSIKRKLRLIPIPFFWIHNETKVILGNDQERNLIVNVGELNGGWILIMAGGGSKIFSSNRYVKFD